MGNEAVALLVVLVDLPQPISQGLDLGRFDIVAFHQGFNPNNSQRHLK